MHPGRRTIVVVAVVLVLAWLPAGSAVASCWSPPVTAPVSDPFREPPCRWCAGNRGLEYATRRGQVVTAVGTGRVTFAGSVAGVTHVVVQHRDGRRITYGRLLRRHHDEGDLVLRGQVVGVADEAFHLGVREGDRYVDPEPLLGRWTGRPRLIPVDGAAATPAPPPVLRCGVPASVAHGAIGATPR